MIENLSKIEKGEYGCFVLTTKLIKRGYSVYRPVLENTKVDIIAEKDNVYYRIQVKTVQTQSPSYKLIPVRKLGHSKTKHKVSRYTKESIDYFVGVDIETEDCYVLPVEFSSKYRTGVSVNTCERYKNNFNLEEPYVGDGVGEQQNIGEPLTGRADGDTEA